MKKHDLEHIVKSKLKERTVSPPSQDWTAIQNSLPGKKSLFSKGSTWAVLSTMVIATIVGVWFYSYENLNEGYKPDQEKPLNHQNLDSLSTKSSSSEDLPKKDTIVSLPETEHVEQIKQKIVPLKPKKKKSETKGKDKIEKRPKVIRIVEIDTVVTREHIYR